MASAASRSASTEMCVYTSAVISLLECPNIFCASAQGVSNYEIQPDKVVFYLWPAAGGSRFGFNFRMRYRVEAMSAPSLVYDYYNPEANATVAPVLFTVR